MSHQKCGREGGRIAILTALILASTHLPLAAKVFRVPGEQSLETALARAGSGDTVELSAGTYLVPASGLRMTSGGVTMRAVGGLAVLDGSGVAPILLVFSAGSAGLVTIEGVEFRGGSSAEAGRAGGVTVSGASVALRNCRFAANGHTVGSGGALQALSGAVVEVTGTTFVGNQATAQGGAVIANDSFLRCTSCVFEDNVAGTHGGAASVVRSPGGSRAGADLELVSSTLARNSAAGEGGAIFGLDSAVRIVDSAFDANRAAGRGGAIARVSATLSLAESALDLELVRTVLRRNTAATGGAAFVQFGQVSIVGSVFADSAATQRGGALAFEDSEIEVRDSDFLDNRVGASGDFGAVAGAIDAARSQLRVRGGRIAGNRSTGSAGAIRSLGGHLDLSFTELADNASLVRGGAVELAFGSGRFGDSRWRDNRVSDEGHQPDASGGALQVIDSAAVVERSSFEANRAGASGGAIEVIGNWESGAQATLLVTDSLFVGNRAAPHPCCPRGNAFGGAIDAAGAASMTVRGSRFEANQANHGGAIGSRAMSVLVEDSVFRGNHAEAAVDDGYSTGGAISMTAVEVANSSNGFGTINRPPLSAEIRRSVFEGRRDGSQAAATFGGCVFVEGDESSLYGEHGMMANGSIADNQSTLLLEDVAFVDCAAEPPAFDAGFGSFGGGVSTNVARLSARRTQWTRNRANGATARGGAIAAFAYSNVAITESIFGGNSAPFGGAVLVLGSELLADGLTFDGNRADGGEGADIAADPSPARPGRPAAAVTGSVQRSKFIDSVGVAVLETDFAAGPINDLRYDGNEFYEGGAGVFRNPLLGPSPLSASQLNAAVVYRSGAASTDKSSTPNIAGVTAPPYGDLVVAPDRLPLLAPPIDGVAADAGWLGFAWRGSAATLGGTPLLERRGLRQIGRPGSYELRVDGVLRDQATVEEASACGSGPGVLCLGGGRFRVEASLSDFTGTAGVAQAVSIPGSDSGLFTFFDPSNWEILVKVLSGCGINQRFWVFAAATTNVEYTLTVTDTATGAQKEYRNPLGVAAAAIVDTDAFASCSGAAAPVVSPAVPSMATSTDALDAACANSATELCVQQGRFRVEVDFRDFQDRRDRARRFDFGTPDSGLFYFFTPENIEMLVKVLDGCAINQRYWVLAAATTNVEYTLTVTDTQSGKVRQYLNRLGEASAAVADADAFATCP